VNGYEELRARIACTTDALAVLQKIIALAREYGAHAGLTVDALGKLARNLEHHVLLASASGTDGARILPTVAGIDGDDHVATLSRRCMGGFDGLEHGRSCRLLGDDRR
jgi:hypothetical protein